MKKIAVIGAGPMGLVAAYELLKAGHSVEIFEQDDRVGGMSASFDFDGLAIERYYHFICKQDLPLFDLLKELGILGSLRWRETRMGYFFNGALYEWGNPFALLKFPHLSFVSKIRYVLNILYCQHFASDKKLDKYSAQHWLQKWLGEEGYGILWKRLLELKFFEHTKLISASWIMARIRRVAHSRKSPWQESMGYLEGGSATLLDALEQRIETLGGTIHLSTGVEEINIANNTVNGVTVKGKTFTFDSVVSTIPLPYLTKTAPNLPEEDIQKIDSIINIGVVCIILKLKKSYSENFWMNICDESIDMAGIIEYTRLYPMDETIVYIPYYMPHTHPKTQLSDQEFITEVIEYMKTIRPDFDESWVLGQHVHRYRYAQTICHPGFFDALPPMQSSINGFFMADTAYYYPEDRSICESARTGSKLARLTDQWIKKNMKVSA
ncbi:MAG: NAD(P)/FAD-dependent oxidoreductase [Rickettsiales bacterium]